MRNLQIEALFGGALALMVIAAVIIAVANTGITGKRGTAQHDDPVPVTASADLKSVVLASTSDADVVCECYDKARSLASSVDVLSSEYRTGFEQCRARANIDGGEAWTAGWNARLDGRAYEASCKAYKRRRS